eukprot:SAG31_NODE_435_length_15733_cov_6.508251_18_plen_133_part_00
MSNLSTCGLQSLLSPLVDCVSLGSNDLRLLLCRKTLQKVLDLKGTAAASSEVGVRVLVDLVVLPTGEYQFGFTWCEFVCSMARDVSWPILFHCFAITTMDAVFIDDGVIVVAVIRTASSAAYSVRWMASDAM